MTTFAQDIKNMMDAYDTMRAKWMVEFGSDNGFDLWFREQLDGK